MAAPGYPTTSEGLPRGGGNITGAPRVASSRPQRTSGPRQPAVARNLNAPHGGKPAPKPQPQRARPAPKPAPAHKAQTPFYGGEIPNYGGATRLQRQEVGAPIHAQQVAEEGAVRGQFGAKQGELNYTEGQIAKRLGGLNQGANTYLQGLIAGQQGSAKTANNFAAEQVLGAQKEVETAGQNAQTNVGGAFANANLANAQAFQAGTAERGQINENNLRGIAAGAAIRGTENEAANRSRFMTEGARNRVAENAALAKVGTTATKERIEAGQKLFTDILAKQRSEGQTKVAETKNALTARGQNIRAGSAAESTTQRARSNRERVIATERGQTLAQYRAQAANEQRENASRRTRATGVERNEIGRRGNEIRQGQYEESDRIAREKIQAQLRKAGASPAAYKLAGELGSAYNSVALLRSNPKEGASPAQIRQFLSTGQSFKQKGQTIKIAKVQNPVLQNAAIELYYNHKVSSTTNAELGQMGINLGQVKAALGL